MIFKSKRNEKKSAEARQNIERLTDEVTKIWNGENKAFRTDVEGSYTGNPVNLSEPEQDADDL